MKITEKSYNSSVKDIFNSSLTWGALGLITYLVFEKSVDSAFGELKEQGYPEDLIKELVLNGYLEI